MSQQRIVVTGAAGHLGGLTVQALLHRGIPASDIVATGRDTTKLAGLAEQGVVVRRADFDEPESLMPAFEGASRVLLVSTFDPGDRVRQHRAAIDAAVGAGVELLVYTSASRADQSNMLMAAEHAETGLLLAQADVPVTILRNAFYVENYTGQLEVYRQFGMAAAATDGQVSLALRREYAEAAAVVLLSDEHMGKTYELGGEATTLPAVAAVLGELTGSQIAFNEVSVEQLREILVGAGVPEQGAAVFADVDRAIQAGELLVPTDDLASLLGRSPLALREAFEEALARRP